MTKSVVSNMSHTLQAYSKEWLDGLAVAISEEFGLPKSKLTKFIKAHKYGICQAVPLTKKEEALVKSVTRMYRAYLYDVSGVKCDVTLTLDKVPDIVSLLRDRWALPPKSFSDRLQKLEKMYQQN